MSPNANGTVSPERRRAVEAAREAWVRRLVDTSRRNNLLYFRDLRSGTLDLGAADPEAVGDLFDGERVPLSRLVPKSADPLAGAKLREIARKARSNMEERGLQTLYVAYGMATWPAEDGGRPAEAAVMLLPIGVEARRVDSDAMLVFPLGPPQANIALLHVLAEEHGIALDEEDLLAEPEADSPVSYRDLVVERLLRAAAKVSDFAVRPRAVIGNFSFQKLAMVRDLRERGAELEASDVVAALAGDVAARTRLGERRVSIAPASLDGMPAATEYLVLDADSSQQAVVYGVAADQDGVVQGPPGCGKSQTIANAIATLVAQGKRVLFVAEKRAALEAVYKRLDARGLGHICLDLHGAAVSQKAVMAHIANALATVRNAPDPDVEAVHGPFEERRARVVAHDRLMHTPVAPLGLTPYELQAQLVAAVHAPRTRWRGADLARIDRAAADRTADLLREAAGHADLFTLRSSSPWNGAALPDGHAAEAALDAAERLAERRLPDLEAKLAAFVDAAGAIPPETLTEAEALVRLVSETNALLASYPPGIFEFASRLAKTLAPAGEGFFARTLAALNGEYRSARTTMDAWRKATPAGHLAAARASEELGAKRQAAGLPVRPSGVIPVEAVASALRDARTDFDTLRAALPALSESLADLRPAVRALAADSRAAHAMPLVRQIEREVTSLGAGTILEEIRGVAPMEWSVFFRTAWHASGYDAARAAHPTLAAFNGETHDRFVAEFRELDQARLRLAAERVRRAHAEGTVDAMNDFPEQASLVRNESQKRSRHVPLRKLLAKAPDVLTAICPCWMSSPLNVSQLISADRRYFDVVVFDEASQVLPEDAVSAVLRGGRLVVAGDRHQLPPTQFFADGGLEEDEEAATTGFESLLDQVAAFVPEWRLEWHYRSRDERLIAFSNRHIYGDSLTTFPGIGGAPAVDHVFVDALPREGDAESATAEVAKVVELVLRHAQERPEESLGVIAMGIKHATRVQAAIDRALDARPDLDPFFNPEREERFFVKNLEQVQGDERDAIILSVGYGKTPDGRLPHRFGPLLNKGGERRLNVAISRAKRRMTVVSSFTHDDIDPRRSSAKGVELLAGFLRFAATQGQDLGEAPAAPSMNALEADILATLTARGIPLVPRHGVSEYQLDFAALHPAHPDRFVMAIECDGATYHAAPTARDRERLRPQQLQSIGWRFHRIWSTDWYLHKDEQVEAVYEAWIAAVAAEEGRPIVEPSETEPVVAAEALPIEKERDPHPEIPVKGQIDLYSPAELRALVRWIASDGLLRTDDEIIAEMLPEIGAKRRGDRIVAAVEAAIREVEGSP
ncbi:MAG: AAA domain-containing protein [Fimbriimonas sp.]